MEVKFMEYYGNVTVTVNKKDFFLRVILVRRNIRIKGKKNE